MPESPWDEYFAVWHMDGGNRIIDSKSSAVLTLENCDGANACRKADAEFIGRALALSNSQARVVFSQFPEEWFLNFWVKSPVAPGPAAAQKVLELTSSHIGGTLTSYLIEMDSIGFRVSKPGEVSPIPTFPYPNSSDGWHYIGLRFDGADMTFHVNGGSSSLNSSLRLSSDVTLVLGDPEYDMIFDELWIGPTSEQKRQMIFQNQAGAAGLSPNFPVTVTYP